jgi:hypothetical protein
MNPNGYKRESIAAIGFIFLNLSILLLGGWFLTDKIMSSSNLLAEKKGEIEATQKSWEQITRSQKDLQLIKPELAKIDEAFVPKNQPIEFINQLENLAQKTSNLFEIDLLTLGGDPKKPENAIAFQIRLTGTFPNLMHFLRYLENMKYFAQVQSMNISRVAPGVVKTEAGEDIPAQSVYSIINLKALTK